MSTFFFYFRSYSIKGILNFLDKDNADQIPHIFIKSLDVHKLTDEDSGDENDCQVDSLNANQFRASLYTSKEEADDTLQREISVTTASCNANKKHIYAWKKVEQTVEIVSFSKNNYKKYSRTFSCAAF